MSVPQIALDAVAHYLSPPHGLTKDISVGLVSVFYAGESGLEPGPQNNSATDASGVLNSHGAFGIASWNGPRQQALADFAKAKGLPAGSVTTQLDFALTEVANSYPKVRDAIWPDGLGKPPGTIAYPDLIPLVVDVYEDPAAKQAETDRSVAFAKELYAAAPSASSAPAPEPPVAPVSPPAPQVIAMEAALVALIPIIEPIVVPLAESLISGIVGGLIKQAPTILPLILQALAAQAVAPAAPAAPSMTIEEIAAAVAKLLQPKAA